MFETSEFHAFLPPSGAGAWVRCPLWPTMNRLYPETEVKAPSLEGTAAHWVMRMNFAGMMPAVGDVAPNGVRVDEEMQEGAELLRKATIERGGKDWQQYARVEQRVQIPQVHATENSGTPDISLLLPLHLHVIDYKYGHGFVDAEENWQGLNYSASWRPILSDAHKVTITIVQPRAYHPLGSVRSWTFDRELLDKRIFQLQMAADEATGDAPQAKPNPDSCEHCPGRHACSGLVAAAGHVMQRAYTPIPVNMTGEQMGLYLRNLSAAKSLLDAHVSGLEEQIEARLRMGDRVPYWKLQKSQPRLSWDLSDREIIEMGRHLQLNLEKTPVAVTPLQAIKAGFPEEAINDFAQRKGASTSLKPDDGRDILRIFNQQS